MVRFIQQTTLDFKAELRSVYRLFKDNAYLIPAYQRDYAWETEQWEQLWDDVSSYKSINAEEHFLGPMIVTPIDGQSDMFEVIDGQQRITTLQLLLALIRDRWVTLGDKSTQHDGAGVPNKQLTSELIYSLTPTVRWNFAPNRHLKEIFRSFIQLQLNDKDRKSFSNLQALKTFRYYEHASELKRAYIYFHTKVQDLDEESLRQFEAYLLNKVQLLVVVAGGASNAYLLFETLNYRGLELTQSDLVKSYLFSKLLVSEEDDSYIDKWDQIIDKFSKGSPDLFLRHYLLLFHPKVRKRDIYADIREKYKSRNQAIALLGSLSHFANIYSYLIRKEKFAGPKKAILNNLFDDLARLNVDTQNVYLMAILHKYFAGQDHIDYDKLEKAGRLCETLSFRWTICGRNAQDLENIYQKAASEIMDKQTPSDNFEKAQQIIFASLPDDEEFKANFSSKVIKSSRRAQYILRKIDQWQTKQDDYLILDPTKVHLEHVAPQKPGPGSSWQEEMEGKLNYREIIYRIGNMALLPASCNIPASNLPFSKKKQKYAACRKVPRLTKELLEFQSWSQAIVLRRSDAIADVATHVWSTSSTDLRGKAPRKKAAKRARAATRRRSAKKVTRRPAR